MINVLHVIGYLGRGGDTTVVLDVMKNMDNSKYHFDFITHDRADPLVVEQLRKLGCKVYVLEGDVRKLGILKYQKEIRSILKKSPYQYDFIHTHTSMQSGIAMMAAKHEGIKGRICHSHVSAVQRKTGKLAKMVTPFFRYLYNHYSTKKVGCSKMAGDFLFGKNEYTLLYNGVDTNRFKSVTENDIKKIENELGINSDEIVIGHVAHFGNLKNQKFDLELSEELKGDNIRFVLVGKGANFEQIKQAAKPLGDRVIFTGQRDDVNVLMKRFDCTILPSLPGEGFPVTMMEAQAAGSKCIISDKVTPEVEVGLDLVEMISTTDKQKWLKLIREIKRNSDINARNHYADMLEEKGFGKQQFVKNWLSLYE